MINLKNTPFCKSQDSADLQVKRLFLWLFVVMLDSCLDNSGLLLCLNPTNELLEELSVGLERFF